MIVTCWKGGNGNVFDPIGYGLKVAIQDRDKYFNSNWDNIRVELNDNITVLIKTNKKSFWNNSCHELISVEVGKWLIENNIAPWPKGNPPKLRLDLISNNYFKLSIL
ncbi:MAG: hypothetical protein PHV30_04725 [Candidatus Margulisbacteria bacterium]|nr:hypothetical protein [Candidatus Margulisiibacteriota bacterium]